MRVFDMEWAAPREEWEVTCRQHVRQDWSYYAVESEGTLEKRQMLGMHSVDLGVVAWYASYSLLHDARMTEV